MVLRGLFTSIKTGIPGLLRFALLHFLQTESLRQPCFEQVYQPHGSNNIFLPKAGTRVSFSQDERQAKVDRQTLLEWFLKAGAYSTFSSSTQSWFEPDTLE